MMKEISLKRVFGSALFMVLFAALVLVNTNYAEAAVSGSLTALTCYTGEEDLGANNEYSGSLVTEGSNIYKSSTVAITTDCSGLISLYYKGNNTESVYVKLFSDEACTNQIDYTAIDASTEAVMTDGLTIPAAGTYYVQLTTYQNVDAQYLLGADIYSSDDGTLKSGVAIYPTIISYDDANYYEIETTKTGIVRVFASYADNTSCYGDISICKKVNGKMKVLATGDVEEDGKVFALPKGTYYIEFSNASANFYALHYKFTGITDKSGSSKAKAKTIPYGKVAQGLIFATDKTSKADWYKFVNSKSRALTLYLDGEVTGGVTLEFYGSDGDKFGSLYISNYTTSDSGSPYVGSYSADSGKLPKGTYYIKVTKDSSDVSGSYTIKLK